MNDGFNFNINLIVKNEDDNIKPEEEGYYFKNVTLFPSKKRFGSKKWFNVPS